MSLESFHNSSNEIKTSDNHETKHIDKDSFDPSRRLDTNNTPIIEKSDSSNDFKPDKRVEKEDIGKNKSSDSSGISEKEHIKEEYRDDNGKQYRDENGLLKNTRYELNGYQYTTDSKGRVTSAEGQIKIKEQSKRDAIKPTMDEIAKGDQKKSDQKGHIIADQLGGSAELGNLVAMDKVLNNREYKTLENSLARETKAGNDVKMKVDIQYPGKSNRPSGFVISYSINGEQFEQSFKNRSRS